MNNEQFIIAGPCAAESRNQLVDCAEVLKQRGIPVIRGCLYKPRTRPGFEGHGSKAVPWAAEVTRMGVVFATEVLIPDHVTEVLKGIDESGGIVGNFLPWIGSRMQNHFHQRGIAHRLADEGPPEVNIMIKNQPWGDEGHWMGIVDHVVAGGISDDRIMLCHRGFYPYGLHNPNNFRNVPDFEMAMRVREKTGLPMIFDPSHVGGTVTNVYKAVELAAEYPFDGLMIEVHPDPKIAMTDAKQQLSYKQLDEILELNKRLREGHCAISSARIFSSGRSVQIIK